MTYRQEPITSVSLHTMVNVSEGNVYSKTHLLLWFFGRIVLLGSGGQPLALFSPRFHINTIDQRTSNTQQLRCSELGVCDGKPLRSYCNETTVHGGPIPRKVATILLASLINLRMRRGDTKTAGWSAHTLKRSYMQVKQQGTFPPMTWLAESTHTKPHASRTSLKQSLSQAVHKKCCDSSNTLYGG